MSEKIEKAERATFARRIVALAMDVIILSITVIPLMQMFYSSIFDVYTKADIIEVIEQMQQEKGVLAPEDFVLLIKLNKDMHIFVGLVSAVLMFVSYVRYEATPGLMLMRCKLTTEELRRPVFLQLLVRFIFGICLLFTSLIGIALCMMTFSLTGRRFPHDILSKTMVLQVPYSESLLYKLIGDRGKRWFR